MMTVSDTSPITNLAAIGLFDPFRSAYVGISQYSCRHRPPYQV